MAKDIATATKREPLFDVVIYHITSRKVDTVIGKKMRRDKGTYNAERRLATACGRINDSYTAAIIKTGAAKKGDVLKDSDFAE